MDCSWSQCFKNHYAQTYARHGFQLSHSCVKPLLNNRQRQKRLAWAKDKKDWTAAEWSKVMFSDESKFCISFGNQDPRVWRKRGEAQDPRCLRSSVKFPQSVMVWGAMSSAGVGPLCFIIPGSAVGRRRMKPLKEAAAPRAPDPRGERVRPPDSAPYLDPSFSNTALLSRTPEHDEDTRSPVYFGHFLPYGHCFIISVEI